MNNEYEHMSWLLRPPENISRQIVRASSIDDLRELATYYLNENELLQVHSRLKKLKAEKNSPERLLPVSIGLLGNFTTKLLSPALTATALRYGIDLNIVETEFNQVAQIAFDPSSDFSNHALDAILVAIDHRGLPLRYCTGDIVTATNNVKDAVSFLSGICGSLNERYSVPIILQNIATPCESIFGSFEGRLAGTLNWQILRTNLEIDGLASESLYVLDVAGLAATVGTANWHDPKLWNMAKIPFSTSYIPIYSDYVCRIIAAKYGKSRRCVILDLDNTLWGGVIGDDGVEGISVGHGDATGEAHLELQKLVLELRNRGLALAVCSKNEEDIAKAAFRDHPDMLLKDSHFAVFTANWTDKASNIRMIAETLSLGLESFVFVDDNPVERMLVRNELPQVAVPELPEDASLFARTLAAGGYFEAVRFLSEDVQRAEYYEKNVQRQNILKQSTDLGQFLTSLSMEIFFAPFNSGGRSRIVQLISKSNQFNLTTRRYDAKAISDFETSSEHYTLQVRLTDALGDNGMISVVICRKLQSYWLIDTWLMSCRVLGRRVEEAVLAEIIAQALKEGVTRLVGEYIVTPRNVIVRDHYKKLGFSQITSEESTSEYWELDLVGYSMPDIPMVVHHAV